MRRPSKHINGQGEKTLRNIPPPMARFTSTPVENYRGASDGEAARPFAYSIVHLQPMCNSFFHIFKYLRILLDMTSSDKAH